MCVNRRELLYGMAAACAGFATPVLLRSQEKRDLLRIDPARLQRRLEELSVYGRPAGGTVADGVSRVAYSDADVGGRKYAIQAMAEAGLKPRIDPAGNIFGARAGTDASLPRILFGSHIDSVPNGGNFDGDVGSMSAIEVMQTLEDHHLTTKHPLEMVIWSNEENLVGSPLAAGGMDESVLSRVFNGIRVEESAATPRDWLKHASLHIRSGVIWELHIEQGGTLDKAKIPIGVVEGIVSIDEYEVEIRGFANHAGTTPMAERRNALLAAAKLIETVQEVVTGEPGRQVGTVGQLQVFPNAHNVVPGLVKHSMELRDLSAVKIARLGDEIQRRAQEIARETKTEILLKKVDHDPPAIADPEIQKRIEEAAAGLGLKTMRLPSGAGHDAQWMARLAPMGMIFVPSVGGISHSPKELTTWQDCANGANVLLHTILSLDRSHG
jgi:beta-ureidopropionase / N-carbamoyl-L-amino-acid hydrolase